LAAPSVFQLPPMGEGPHYRQVAESFVAQPSTRAAHQSAIEPWRKGRERYWCWCITLEDGAILERFRRYQRRLSPFLLKNYRRQRHITVAVCGFWQEDYEAAEFNDSFTADQLAIQLDNLAALPLSPFELKVLGSNSFPSAPFLEVVDNSPNNQLSRLRQCLLLGTDDFRSSVYCPHLTLGLYDREYSTSELHFLLGDHEDRQPLSLMVSSLTLMSYDARELAGPLTMEKQVMFVH